jgi:hypothetical protein
MAAETPQQQFNLLEALRQLAEANKPRHPLIDAGMPQAQVDKVTGKTPPWIPRFRYIVCKSVETGATFEAHVLSSRDEKRFPHGRVVALRNYRHPEGTQTYRQHGGRVPDGLQILRNGSSPPAEGQVLRKEDATPQYLQWRWSEFWQADLRRHINKGPELCADLTGLKTPWQEGHIGLLSSYGEEE